MIKSIRYWVIRAVGVSKGEANAVLILVPLLLLIIILPPFYNQYFTERYASYKEDQAILDSMLAQIQQAHLKDSISSLDRLTLERFDPNTAPLELLESNGISKGIAKRIIKYREKGGEFRKKEDLLRIYGMGEELYNTIAPYIYMPESPKPKTVSKSKANTYIKPTVTVFDLNTADTTTFKQVYGIGNKLSTRIVAFRDQLGGFISTDQLQEVYGLRPVTIDSLLRYGYISDDFVPHQININTDTISTLSQHPYIEYRIAKAIVNYRRQHGDYKEVEELKNLHLMSDSVYHRIIPYLVVEH